MELRRVAPFLEEDDDDEEDDLDDDDDDFPDALLRRLALVLFRRPLLLNVGRGADSSAPPAVESCGGPPPDRISRLPPCWLSLSSWLVLLSGSSVVIT